MRTKYVSAMNHRYAIKISHRIGTMKGSVSYFFRNDYVYSQTDKPPLNDAELYEYVKRSQRTYSGSERRFIDSPYYNTELLSYQVVTLGDAIEEWRSHWQDSHQQ